MRIVHEGPKGATVEVAGVDEAWATRFALSFAGDAEVVAPPPARYPQAERASAAKRR